MTRATLELLADSSQIRRANRDLQNVNRTGGATEGITKAVGRAFVALTAAISVRQIQQAADTYKSLQNQLRVVTNDSENLLAVTDALKQAAENSRGGIESTVTLYSKLARSTLELGLSQGELIDLTETINKSFAVSGASAQEADGAIRQLAQGLSAGALRGDEFNTVAENAPSILRAVAVETGLTVGELRKFAGEGKITTELLISSLQNYSKTVDGEFAGAGLTIGAASTELVNDFTDLIGAIDDTTKTSGLAATGITILSEAFEDLAVIVRSGVISDVLAVQFETILDDLKSFERLFTKQFGGVFDATAAAAEETGSQVGAALTTDLISNITTFTKVLAVELAAGIDLVGRYTTAVGQTLNPFDGIDIDDARGNFSDASREVADLRASALQDVFDAAEASSKRKKIVIDNAKQEILTFKELRKARIEALSTRINDGGLKDNQSPEEKAAAAALKAQKRVDNLGDGTDKKSFDTLKRKLILQTTSLDLSNDEFEIKRNIAAIGENASQAQIDTIKTLTTNMQALRFEAELLGPTLSETFGEIGSGAIGQFSDAITQSIISGESLGDTLKNVAGTILTTLISATIEYGIRQAAAAVFGTAAVVTGEATKAAAVTAGVATQTAAATGALGVLTGASVVSSGVIAVAAAPAAAAVSIATAGAAPAAAAPIALSTIAAIIAGIVGVGLLARSQGGQVSQGTSYLVGERGPERFNPNGSGGGRITPFNQLMSEARGGSNSETNNNANITFALPANVKGEFREQVLQNRDLIYNVVQKALNERGRKF